MTAPDAPSGASEQAPRRCGLVAIVGRPNVGKSTLLNALLARKVSIVTPKPQTTRHRILGILSRPEYQIAIVDTPGIHDGHRRMLNQYMNRSASASLEDADVIVFVVEALIGAVYLDAGFEPARALVDRLVQPRLAGLPGSVALKDAKTRLQEWLQGRGLPLPRYTVLDVRGEPHDQEFTVHCEVEPLGVTCEGRGASRRRAEQEAAESALSRLVKNPRDGAESNEGEAGGPGGGAPGATDGERG